MITTVWIDTDDTIYVLHGENGPYLTLSADGRAAERFTLPDKAVQVGEVG